MIIYGGYIITNGTTFVESSDFKTITTDYRKAYTWKTQLAAANVLSDMQKSKSTISNDYYIEQTKSYITPINEDTKYFIDNVSAFFDLYGEISDSLKDLSKRLSETDRKISDVEHFIEITDQNAVNGYKLYKKLKDLRIERRNIKRLLELKQIFDKIKIDDSIEKDIDNKIESFKTKVFSPREIDIEKILGD